MDTAAAALAATSFRLRTGVPPGAATEAGVAMDVAVDGAEDALAAVAGAAGAAVAAVLLPPVGLAAFPEIRAWRNEVPRVPGLGPAAGADVDVDVGVDAGEVGVPFAAFVPFVALFAFVAAAPFVVVPVAAATGVAAEPVGVAAPVALALPPLSRLMSPVDDAGVPVAEAFAALLPGVAADEVAVGFMPPVASPPAPPPALSSAMSLPLSGGGGAGSATTLQT